MPLMLEAHSAMKKVICPNCGLINLEKFITYPHCAGCGVLLPVDAVNAPILFWQQPLRVPMWVAVIALCCTALGILGITIARETGHGEEKQLVLYAQVPHQMSVGRQAPLQIALDTMSSDEENNFTNFENVQVRIPLPMKEDFSIVAISPFPNRVTASGAGNYIEFDTLPRDQPIRLLLRPMRAGQHRLAITLFVGSFMPFTYRSTIAVSPRVSTAPPGQKPTRHQAAKVTKLR